MDRSSVLLTLHSARRRTTLLALVLAPSHRLLAALLVAAIGMAAGSPSLDPVAFLGPESDEADRRPDRAPHHRALHLDAFECETEETEKADCIDAASEAAFAWVHGGATAPSGLALQERSCGQPLDPICAHAPRGPPSA